MGAAMNSAKRLTVWLMLWLGLGLISSPLGAQDLEPALDISVLQAPPAVTIDDILANRADRIFSPTLQRSLSLKSDKTQVNWVRIRADLPQAGDWRLFSSLPSGAMLQLYKGEPSPELVIETRILGVESEKQLQFSVNTPGPVTLFLRVEHEGTVLFKPALLQADLQDVEVNSLRRNNYWLIGAFGFIALLAFYRFRVQPTEHSYIGIAIAAILFIAACVFAAKPDLLGLGQRLGSYRLLPWALALIAFSRLIPLTAQAVAIPKHAPQLIPLITGMGLVIPLLAVGLLFLPHDYVSLAEKLLAMLIGMLLFFATLLPLFDTRNSRWFTIIILCIGLLCFPLYVIATWHGFSIAAALEMFLPWLAVALLINFLIQPWFRRVNYQRDIAKRKIVPELSAEEKISRAREELMQSLSTGLAHADQDELEWIAFRRLLAGLKSVLSQRSSAVVAMNYHGQDLLITDINESEEKYRMLLDQRTNVLRTLSRMRAPQQMRMDFDREGPMLPVMMAIIPLPIERPGWGAMLVERADGVTYSDAELDLCAEFASLACTAGDEAASTLAAKRAAETDSETGLFNREYLQNTMSQYAAKPGLTRGPCSCLMLRLQHADPQLRSIGQWLREESDYGDTVGRFSQNEFMVLGIGKHASSLRELADELLKGLNEQLASAPEAKISIGLSSITLNERSHAALIERLYSACDAAAQPGVFPIQVVNAIE
jgi:GGDEF domain-containing protein